jgi:arsenite methyltransferase
MVSNHSTDTVFKQQIAEHNDNLELQLSQIGKIFDIPRLIDEPQRKPQIINYYTDLNFVYKLFEKMPFIDGSYHYGISYDGKLKKEDFQGSAKIVERYIHDSNAKNVLELAYGWGGNIAFLAKRNPEVTFEGVDLSLSPLKSYAKIPNAHFQIGDYHDLSAFKDNAYDIVFVIESLCYSTNKLQVLREAKKKLKRGGLFMVIDGYRRDRATPLSSSEEIMQKLIEVSWAVDKFERVKDVEGYMQEEYSIAAANDSTQCILPSATKVARQLRYYFAHPMFARVANKLLSSGPFKGFIAAYLIPASLRRQIFCHYVHVIKNDR